MKASRVGSSWSGQVRSGQVGASIYQRPRSTVRLVSLHTGPECSQQLKLL